MADWNETVSVAEVNDRVDIEGMINITDILRRTPLLNVKLLILLNKSYIFKQK